jgi:hypothetical protein
VIDEDAFVYQLKDAGAVLIAKLSMGELAMDDIWFGGQTKTLGICNKVLTDHPPLGIGNRCRIGTFAIGTETYGSIVAPSAVCGATGLRPTFGSVARTGGMNLGPPTVLDQFAAALKIVHWYSLPYMVAIHTILHELCL